MDLKIVNFVFLKICDVLYLWLLWYVNPKVSSLNDLTIFFKQWVALGYWHKEI